MTESTFRRHGDAVLSAGDFLTAAANEVIDGIEEARDRERAEAEAEVELARKLRRSPKLTEIDLLKEKNAERREYLELYRAEFRQSLSDIRNEGARDIHEQMEALHGSFFRDGIAATAATEAAKKAERQDTAAWIASQTGAV